MQEENKPVLLNWLMLFALMLIWGSSFILIKRGLEVFSNLQVGALRVGLSFLFLLPLAITRIWRVKRQDLKYFFWAGFLGNGLPAFLFAKAQTGLDSLMAGILNSLTPVFTLVVGLLFFSIKTKAANITGVVVGLIGAIGLLYASSEGNPMFSPWYALMVIAATLGYAMNMNILKHFLKQYDSLTITSVAFVFIGIPSLIFLLAGTDFLSLMATEPRALKGLGYILILSLVGTSLAMIAHNWLIKRTSALFASSVTYLMPVVSILWGVWDGEKFLGIFLLWIAVILAGVYMANRPVKKQNASLRTEKP